MFFKPAVFILTLFTAATVQAQTPRGAVLKSHTRSHSSHSARPMAEIYQLDAVDVPPEFPGGNNAMACYINRELRYPKPALEAGTCGRVLCGFVVNTDGKVTDVTVIRRVSPELDREAVRIISNMPRWNAAQHEGQNVAVFYMLPINFRL